MIPFVLVLLLTLSPQPAFAYLDPGSGSMLVSGIMGLLAALLFFLKGIYYKAWSGIFRIVGMKGNAESAGHKLVFYSEGRQYWSTFKPVIDELTGRNVLCTYLTSDRDDPGLLYTSELLRTRFIGTDTKAYSYLRFLEADLCAMTTPGLDVLQIKRSRGVKHYAHLIHAPTDAATYKTYAFDYYDSVLASGDHQINSIRKLEALRGTQPKRLLKTGCLYYDEMKKQLQNVDATTDSKKHITVLVAPTWGANGLLRIFGTRILVPLLEHQFNVILRPHPQSQTSEKEMLEGIRDEVGHFSNLRWDNEGNGMRSMVHADVMVSDFSGIVFDFAFVFERPVITLKYDLNKLGLEAADLPWDPWEVTVIDSIGQQIDEKDIGKLPEIIERELASKTNEETIAKLRDESVYNFACAAPHVANELMHICDEIQGQRAM